MKTGSVDYASSYFKYKTATPIRGEPTNKALKRLKLELQANASSVETDLGGGDHGYLGLVLTDQEYASIPGTEPFIAPMYPGPLDIPNNATPIQALNLKDQHSEEKRLHLECRNVERALMRHIQDAIEEKYLESLIDEYTNLITGDTPTVLEYLFYNYGKVRSDEVSQKESEVMSLIWQPSDPMVILTRPLEQLQKLAVQAGMPCTDNQILQKGLQLIRNTNDFEYALTQWEDKTESDKTWENFKNHFHEHQLKLKSTRGPTMQQAGYHHANVLALKVSQDIEEKLQERDQHMLAMLQNIPSLIESSSSSSLSQNTDPSQVASSITSDQTQLAILQLLRDMQLDMKKLPSGNTARGNGNTNNQRRQNKKTPDDSRLPRTDTSQCCWTHGAWNHPGTKCRFKAQGHKDQATFDNKMGGSCAHCE